MRKNINKTQQVRHENKNRFFNRTFESWDRILRTLYIIAFCYLTLCFISLFSSEILPYYLINQKFDEKRAEKASLSKESVFNNSGLSDSCINLTMSPKKFNSQQATAHFLIEIDIPRVVLMNLCDVLKKTRVIGYSDSSSQKMLLKPGEMNRSINIHFSKIFDDQSTTITIPLTQVCENYNSQNGMSRIVVEKKFSVHSHSGSFPWDIAIFAKKIWVVVPPLFYYNVLKQRMMLSLPTRIVVKGQDAPDQNMLGYSDLMQGDNFEFQGVFLKLQSKYSTKIFVRAIIVSVALLIIYVGYMTFPNKNKQQVNDSDTILLGLAGFAFALVTLRNGFLPLGMQSFTILDYIFGFLFSLVMLYIKIISLNYILSQRMKKKAAKSGSIEFK